MLKIGPYRAVYEAHQAAFRANGYQELESAGMAQAIVSHPLPDIALTKTAAYLEATLPDVQFLLNGAYPDISLAVENALDEQRDLFLTPQQVADMKHLFMESLFSNLVVCVCFLEDQDYWYAADWSINEAGQVTFTNVRDVSAYHQTLTKGVVEGLLPAIDVLQYAMSLPLEVEHAYLTSVVAGQEFTVPAAKTDGGRPVEETEFVRFLRQTEVLSESVEPMHDMPGGIIKENTDRGTAFVRLALVEFKVAHIERQCFEARLRLVAPLTEKSTTIQSVIVSKAKFSKSQAEALAKRNNWSGKIDETDTSFRMRQRDPDSCQDGSFNTIKLKEGVQAVICKLKNGAKNEQTLTEAPHGDFRAALQSKGFEQGKDVDGCETHCKDLGGGKTIQVKLKAGKAHTSLMHNGIVRGYVASSMTVGGMHSDIEDAGEESGETNAIEAGEGSAVGQSSTS